jgi:hypothetical protein
MERLGAVRKEHIQVPLHIPKEYWTMLQCFSRAWRTHYKTAFGCWTTGLLPQRHSMLVHARLAGWCERACSRPLVEPSPCDSDAQGCNRQRRCVLNESPGSRLCTACILMGWAESVPWAEADRVHKRGCPTPCSTCQRVVAPGHTCSMSLRQA